MDQSDEEALKRFDPRSKYVQRLLRVGRFRDRNLTEDDVIQALWADHLEHEARPVDRGPLLDGKRTRRRTTDFEREFLASLHPISEVGVRADRAGRWPKKTDAAVDRPAKKNRVWRQQPVQATDKDGNPVHSENESSALDHLVERERQKQIADLLSNSGLTAVERDAVLGRERGTSRQAVWKAEGKAFKKLRARATQRGWMPEAAATKPTWPKEFLVGMRDFWLRGTERWRQALTVSHYPAQRLEFEYVAPRPPSRQRRTVMQWAEWRPDNRSYRESPPPLGLESARRGPRALYYGRPVSRCCIGEGGRQHDRACLHRAG